MLHGELMNERKQVAAAIEAGTPMTTGCEALVALKAATGKAKEAATAAKAAVEGGREQLAKGCSKHSAWRYSDLLRHDGSPRTDLAGEQGWGSKLMGGTLEDRRWCTRVEGMAAEWWTNQVNDCGVMWEWNPAQVMEHPYLATVTELDGVQLCRVVKCAHNADLLTQEDPGCSEVQVV